MVRMVGIEPQPPIMSIFQSLSAYRRSQPVRVTPPLYRETQEKYLILGAKQLLAGRFMSNREKTAENTDVFTRILTKSRLKSAAKNRLGFGSHHPKGIISDMDGVILDSEKLYVRFWCEAGRFYGYPMEEYHALSIRSMARPFAIERLQGFFGEDFDYDAVRNKRIELMDKYVAENGIEAKPGAEKLLCYLKEKRIKTALATATPVDRAKRYLEAVGLLKYFDEVCSARMVKNGKPAPDIYLYAAEKLNLPPGECIALEDSPNGIRSAHAAGCKTVMVPDLDLPTEEIKPLLYDIADGLEDVIRIIGE